CARYDSTGYPENYFDYW
nr:immunoglobulin heavy chain junction region [Mus musculus]NSM05119.1 immunoglobulin heavy chain junction region [Mus musculus]